MLSFGKELDYALANAAVGACDDDGQGFCHCSSVWLGECGMVMVGPVFYFCEASVRIVSVRVVMSSYVDDVTSSFAFIDDHPCAEIHALKPGISKGTLSVQINRNYQAGVSPTRVPFNEQHVSVSPSSHGPASLLSILANDCTNRTVT